MAFEVPPGDGDGFLSSRQEWHALTVGIAVGFVSITPIPKTREFVFLVVGLVEEGEAIENGDLEILSRFEAIKEAKRASTYAVGGVLLGVLLAIAVGALAAFGLLSAPEHIDTALEGWLELLENAE